MKKHILTLAIAATLLASSCKRNNSSFDGPSLSDLNGQFGMLQPFQASKSSVDFSKAETVGFTAKFTKLCDWTIRRNLSLEKVELSIRLPQPGMAAPPFSQCSKTSPAWPLY
jgi:hypothetical protein